MTKIPFNDGKMVVVKTATGEYSGGQGITITNNTISVNYESEAFKINDNGKLDLVVELPIPPAVQSGTFTLLCTIIDGEPIYTWSPV